MNNKTSKVLLGLGILFLLNAIFGRYLVLPGYLAGLEQGTGTLEGARQAVSTWKIIRYLLWGYSFKLGMYFLLLGAIFKTNMSSVQRGIFAAGGFLYLAFAYIPLPNPNSIIFGISGGIMTLLMIYIFFGWAKERPLLPEGQKKASDYHLAGIFFFAMATYTLCPLLGVKTFALAPEKMIQYGLQAEAASYAFHILLELVLGWLFLALSFHYKKGIPSNG